MQRPKIPESAAGQIEAATRKRPVRLVASRTGQSCIMIYRGGSVTPFFFAGDQAPRPPAG